MPRRIYVDMDALLDAIDTHDRAVAFVLDVDTGAVELDAHEDFAGGQDDRDPARFRPVPQREARQELELMRGFADALDEPEVRGQLAAALAGRDARTRFRAVLAQHPDLRARFQERKRDVLLEAALVWLGELDVEPRYELRALPVARAPAASQARLGVYDLLLLGSAPADEDGAAAAFARQVRARNPEQARNLFAGLARDLAEQNGVAWRNRLIEGRDHYEVGRAQLRLDGERVELRVEVPPEARRLFPRIAAE
jgi:hypothetical protein